MLFNFNRLFEYVMSGLFLSVGGGQVLPAISRDAKPINTGDQVSVCGVVTRVDPTGNNYGPKPTVTLLTDNGFTPEVPARNVNSAQGSGSSTVLSRDGKFINVGDFATIVGTVASTPSREVVLDADNNSQVVQDKDCYSAQTL